MVTMRVSFIGLLLSLMLAGCASVDGNEKTSFNTITGGYRIVELAPDIYLVTAKSGLYFPAAEPLLPTESVVLALMGQGIKSARKRWVELADGICGAGRYKVYGVEEYSYRYSLAYPQHVAAKSAYIVCDKGQYTDESVKKILDIK